MSLVRKDTFVNTLLDDCPSAKKPMAEVKERLHKLLHADYPDCATDNGRARGAGEAADGAAGMPRTDAAVNAGGSGKGAGNGAGKGSGGSGSTNGMDGGGTGAGAVMRSTLNPCDTRSVAQALDKIGQPKTCMADLHASMVVLVDVLHSHNLCNSKGIVTMSARWVKLVEDFYKPKKNLYNVSKIPDIFDTAKHDLRHNCQVNTTRKPLCQVFHLAALLGAVIIPQE